LEKEDVLKTFAPLQYVNRDRTRYFISCDPEKLLKPTQLSKKHNEEGGLTDSWLDDVKGFHRVDKVSYFLFGEKITEARQ
jgi:hypothetical protein